MSEQITLIDALLLLGGLWIVTAWLKRRLFRSGDAGNEQDPNINRPS
ncbi:MAG: hypothetical protein HQL99_14565 [Magnetococcales bacterium]|nr:hypothetical protein [Magnetococcales bacterium]